MRLRSTSVLVGLAWISLLAASCGSSSSDDSASGGHASGSGGTSGSAGTSPHAGNASGGTSSGGGGKGGATSSGGSVASGGGAGSAVGVGGASGRDGDGVGGEAGGGTAGAPPSVLEVMCVRDSDCLAACNANGWPLANCFGAETRYCACKTSTTSPSCVNGTLEGCPIGLQCRGTSSCVPYGTATDGVPCDNGDECAPDYTCVKYGNPLPSGESTACRRWCASNQPLPSDCYGCSNGLYCDPRPEGAAGAGG